MHLVQFLLPLRDPDGTPFPRAAFDEVRRELTETFGGSTAYLRAPAEGAWKEPGGEVVRDEVVVYEVVSEQLDRSWWQEYRRKLEQHFRQKSVLVRAQKIELL